MKQPRISDGCDPLVDRPWDVQVTILPGPHASAAPLRIAGIPLIAGVRGLFALAIALAAVGAVLMSVVRTPARPRVATSVAAVHVAGPSPAADPFRYPLGCLGASVPGTDPVAAARRFDPGSPCWRYGVYVTAILRPVHGIWRLALEAVSRSCPAVSLPPRVRAQLAVCVRR